MIKWLRLICRYVGHWDKQVEILAPTYGTLVYYYRCRTCLRRRERVEDVFIARVMEAKVLASLVAKVPWGEITGWRKREDGDLP